MQKFLNDCCLSATIQPPSEITSIGADMAGMADVIRSTVATDPEGQREDGDDMEYFCSPGTQACAVVKERASTV